jgi:DNA-binding transcriptional ArsR family regulator
MVARTSIDRVQYEMSCVVNGHPWAGRPNGTASVQLASAVERGEQHFAGRVADELDQFCQSAITPRWPRLRARMEEDISGRMDVVARHGYGAMISGLAATTRWRDSGLDIDVAARGPVSASAVIFAPCPFTGRPMHCIDTSDAPGHRTPLIAYPAINRPRVAAASLDELIGTTRARLLAELSTPRSTPELASLLYLSPSTVSYHLQILHRAGLTRRIRRSRRVLYQITQQAPAAGKSPDDPAGSRP